MDGPVRLAPAAARVAVDGEDLVAPSRQHGGEEPADEALADDEHSSVRHPLGAPQDAGERLDHRRPGIVDPVGQVDPAVRPHPLGKPARPDRARPERLAGRLVTGVAARALAAREVVDERDAAAVDLGDDLVPEHRSRRRAAELLDVRPAEAAGEHAGERSRAFGVGDLREPRLPLLVQYDGAHGSIVGRWRSSSTAAARCG